MSGYELRELRVNGPHGYVKLRHLSKVLGAMPQELSDWESGKAVMPDTLASWAEFYLSFPHDPTACPGTICQGECAGSDPAPEFEEDLA